MGLKRDKGDEQLRALKALEGRTLNSEELAFVGKALHERFNMVNAKAALLLGQQGNASHIEDLEQLFERAMTQPVKTDPGCLCKLAVVEALSQLEYQGSKLFLRAMSHVQLEPVWGTNEDTAGELRGRAFMALVTMGYADALFNGMPLLVDSELETRQLAVAAFGHSGAREAELILRMKVLTRDSEPRVMAECFYGLMKLNPDRSLPFVSGYMEDGDEAVAAGAAIAIGESKHVEGFSRLKHIYETARFPSVKDTVLTAMKLLRSDEANEFLTHVIGSSHSSQE